VSGGDCTRAHVQDFIATAVLAVLWLFAAIAWAFSAGSLSAKSNAETLSKKVLLTLSSQPS
jgi:hypothetical protein